MTESKDKNPAHPTILLILVLIRGSQIPTITDCFIKANVQFAISNFTMKKIFLLLAFFATIALTGCNNYGKKVKINDKLEVYVKGDSATETDAKKLGDYFVRSVKEIPNKISFQLLKENGTYVVKMVIDQAKVKANPELESSFAVFRNELETFVYPGSPVKFVVTDDHFKDIKSY